jgi:hypothetical protein
MTYQSAIPTKYKGVQFRSRLEARWAAYFDLVDDNPHGIRNPEELRNDWEYEPFDLPGWIPDFQIKTPRFGLRLVEVKPLFTPSVIRQTCEKVRTALRESGFRQGPSPYAEYLSSRGNHDLVRAWWRPCEIEELLDTLCKGFRSEPYMRESASAHAELFLHVAVFLLDKPHDGLADTHFGIRESGSYTPCLLSPTGRMTSTLDCQRAEQVPVSDAWQEAGNIVQWRKPEAAA